MAQREVECAVADDELRLQPLQLQRARAHLIQLAHHAERTASAAAARRQRAAAAATHHGARGARATQRLLLALARLLQLLTSKTQSGRHLVGQKVTSASFEVSLFLGSSSNVAFIAQTYPAPAGTSRSRIDSAMGERLRAWA